VVILRKRKNLPGFIGDSICEAGWLRMSVAVFVTSGKGKAGLRAAINRIDRWLFVGS